MRKCTNMAAVKYKKYLSLTFAFKRKVIATELRHIEINTSSTATNVQLPKT